MKMENVGLCFYEIIGNRIIIFIIQRLVELIFRFLSGGSRFFGNELVDSLEYVPNNYIMSLVE
jgi:hypothetical protein